MLGAFGADWVSGPEPVELNLINAKLEENLFNLDDVDLSRVAETAREAVERAAIEDALRRHAGNISRVADELGLSRVGLRAKIDRFQLSRACPDDK